MVKKIVTVVIVVGIVVGLVMYFKIEKIDKRSVGDVVYEIVEEENIPGEVMDEISGYGKEMRRASYLCSDEMYIVVYYGEQPTDGYSIEVSKVYESDDVVYIETVLMGPKSSKEINEVVSYPYVVIKIPVHDKKVVFI